MKNLCDLEVGDKIFVWDCRWRKITIGEIVKKLYYDNVVFYDYRKIIGDVWDSDSHIIALPKDECQDRNKYYIVSMYQQLLISSSIDDILELIE